MHISQLTWPKVTVVTINYNMADALAVTIESVLEQNYDNLEYVVIDAASTDSSVDVIEKHGAEISWWKSEPDRGRYDGMNKGVASATGEWIIFMNAGDRFHDPYVISDVFRALQDDADIIYGHALRVYPHEGVQRVIRSGPPTMLPVRMNCCHQSMFTRRKALLRRPYASDLVIAADLEYLIWAKNNGLRFKAVDRIVCVFSAGGISDRDRRRAIQERWKVLTRQNQVTVRNAIEFTIDVVWGLVGGWLRHVLPKPLVRLVLRYK